MTKPILLSDCYENRNMKQRMINNKKAIPWALNMSFGLFPAILCMILSELIPDSNALIISTLTGIAYSFGLYYLSRKRIYNFILFITTFSLLFLWIASILPGELFPRGTVPFTLELVIIMLTALLFYGQTPLKKLFNKKRCPLCEDLIIKSLDSSIVSARIIFIMGILHFITATLFMFIGYPLEKETSRILFQILPPVLFFISICINQIGIHFANRIIDTEEEIPVVNEQGNVIGKRFKVEAPIYKDMYINPVVRIALIYDGMLFLCKRKSTSIADKNKTDIPLETYLQFGEKPEDGVERILKEPYPEGAPFIPRFSIKHHFKTESTNRLIYLYIAYITDDEFLCNPYYQEGKLWMFTQIEQNLGKNYFSECFENEYEHLKTAVEIWETFK